MTTTYPDGCLQRLFDAWWVDDPKDIFCRGRLIHAPVTMVGQVPLELVPNGRGENARDHNHGQAVIKEFHIRATRNATTLPVAGLTLNPGEICIVYKAKVRPALILGEALPDMKSAFGTGAPKTHYQSPLLIAPYYSVMRDGTRTGFSDDLVQRASRAEYPQYMWDVLPEIDTGAGSILRIDQMQPLGRNAAACRPTKWKLSKDALGIMDEWIDWVFDGETHPDSTLRWLRSELAKL